MINGDLMVMFDGFHGEFTSKNDDGRWFHGDLM